MLKKLLITSSLLAVGSGMTFAGGMASAPTHGYSFVSHGYTYQADPYVGLSIGPRLNITGTPFTYAGVEGTLSAGLSHLWDQGFYLAGELFLADSASLKTFGGSSIPPSVTAFRSTWSVGFDLLPGVKINELVLGYLRLGVINTEFTMNNNQGNQSSNNTAWQAGLGFQTKLYKNLDTRLEYIYSRYSSTDNPPVGTVSANQTNLGLVYTFG